MHFAAAGTMDCAKQYRVRVKRFQLSSNPTATRVLVSGQRIMIVAMFTEPSHRRSQQELRLCNPVSLERRWRRERVRPLGLTPTGLRFLLILNRPRIVERRVSRMAERVGAGIVRKC